ncbi:hypothetical protein KAFR_0K02110 [Kazachstania africana CBS 2517]|uniref:Arrestin C-terminal-like domain-containing protein n=1 Tax=Kazachstania africana (strain ATCC 22294 / BCRC 22015 / CBS 2517 / CECT 1963 / NBRC 1671 / NRRL Y-8276) TaxID=1071382 RepID=H2B1R5_KAZAF|nr:hypothetical protein KAFR_0K02110 [Kazachstania africana CBS 2517]CCF60565.1 hypothetical protein KAFR_0K02110 [Kazachstania africana CBS 2517]
MSSLDNHSDNNHTTAGAVIPTNKSFSHDVNVHSSIPRTRKQSAFKNILTNILHSNNDTITNSTYTHCQIPPNTRRHSTPSVRSQQQQNLNTPRPKLLRSDSRTFDSKPNFFKDEYLVSYLSNKGFTPQKFLFYNKDLKISIASAGEAVFLPTISNTEVEDLARNGHNDGSEGNELQFDQEDNNSFHSDGEDYTDNESDDISDNTPIFNSNDNESNDLSLTNLQSLSASQQNRFPSSTPVVLDSSMSAYNIAIILSLQRETQLSTIQLELSSNVRVHWRNGLPPTKSINEEYYKTNQLNWSLNSRNFDLFIPCHSQDENDIIQNNHSSRKMRLFRSKPNRLNSYLTAQCIRSDMFNRINKDDIETLKAGDYVFAIPIAFHNRIPESLYYPSARIAYLLRFACYLTNSASSFSTASNSSSSSISSNIITGNDTLLDFSNDIETEVLSSKDNTVSSSSTSSMLKKFSKHFKNTAKPNPSSIVNGLNSHEIFLEYPLNVVRTPPLISMSTANKPIFIKRLWSSSLIYEVSFPQKYVPLNSEVPISIKLTPLIKDLQIKRIKVSVVEKITFSSKNYQNSFDQIDVVKYDMYSPYYGEMLLRRRKERNLPLLEIRTKVRGSQAIREEIVKNSNNENLLSYSSINDNDDTSKKYDITEPISVESKIKFPKYNDVRRKSGKILPPYGIDHFLVKTTPEANNLDRRFSLPTLSPSTSSANRSNRSKSIAQLLNSSKASNTPSISESMPDDYNNATIFKCDNSTERINFTTRLNEPKRGLYLDSKHSGNIRCKHKLEIMFRISKPDDLDRARMRHFEVVIDTPIFLISDLCNQGNMDLPSYERNSSRNVCSMSQNELYNSPPTFEEAMSVPASPESSPSIISSSTETLNDMRRLSLGTTISTNTLWSKTNPFNNLDRLLTAEEDNDEAMEDFFKQGYTLHEAFPPSYDEATSKL